MQLRTLHEEELRVAAVIELIALDMEVSRHRIQALVRRQQLTLPRVNGHHLPHGQPPLAHELFAELRDQGAALKVAGILLTMLQQDQAESLEVARELRDIIPPSLFLRSSIPRDSAFLKASAIGVPLGLLHRNPPAAALVFDQLAAELETRMGIKLPPDDHGYTRLMD